MAIKVQALVRLKPGVLDVQGKAVEQGLKNIGREDVHGVRIGRLIELEVDAKSWSEAEIIAKELCQKVLANTVIEQFEIRQVS